MSTRSRDIIEALVSIPIPGKKFVVWIGGGVIPGGGSNVLDAEESWERAGSVAVERKTVRSLLLTISLDVDVLVDDKVSVIGCRAVSIAEVADDIADTSLEIC